MFDIGWSELLLIGIVALIVIGPKDLPEMFRTLGRFTAKARGMAREFSRAMEAAADEAGVKDVAKDIKDAANVRNMGLDTMKDAARKFEAWDPLKPAKAAAAAPVVAVGPKPATAKPAEAQTGAEAAPAPAKPMGPATAALAEARAAKRAEARAAKARAASAEGDV